MPVYERYQVIYTNYMRVPNRNQLSTNIGGRHDSMWNEFPIMIAENFALKLVCVGIFHNPRKLPDCFRLFQPQLLLNNIISRNSNAVYLDYETDEKLKL